MTKIMAGTAATLEEVFSGSALGTLVGDAFGAAVEGWPPDRIRDRYGTLTGPVSGRYTDDTEMTIGVIEALIEDPSFSAERCALRFLENYDPTRGYGARIAGVMQRIRRREPLEAVGTDSFGNGAAMRVAPIGFFFFNDQQRLASAAVRSARITHTHPLGVAGAVAQATAVGLAAGHAMRGEPIDRDRFLDGIIRAAGSVDDRFLAPLETVRRLSAGGTEEAVEALISNFPRDVTAPGAVPAAVAAFLLGSSFREAVTIAVNAGGDADTVGAMAGAIAGAYYGRSAIPEAWLSMMENGARGRDYIGERARRLAEIKRGNHH
jgi:poly(ADP-ribose) glycohydrolase ARH3